jgi:4-hydroxy-3-methylbut-2-enyl diphosphate reductase IspH
MDDVVNRLARELSDAISAAVADDARVEAARERARAAGFEMKITLEAVIGFMNRSNSTALAKVATSAVKGSRAAERSFEISANDKRFLRSLRIAADEPQEKEVE